MTANDEYTQRLLDLSQRRWKQRLGAQAPYRWNLRRLRPGRVLDVGCGVGRNLAHLDGNGVGVDHNVASVAAAHRAGFTAFTPEDFFKSGFARPHAFDSLLVAHVLEHVEEQTAVNLIRSYLPYVRPAGQVVVITPQERGFRSDETHVRFVDAERARRDIESAGAVFVRDFSFPFVRAAGRWFPYNEFVVLGRTPG